MAKVKFAALLTKEEHSIIAEVFGKETKDYPPRYVDFIIWGYLEIPDGMEKDHKKVLRAIWKGSKDWVGKRMLMGGDVVFVFGKFFMLTSEGNWVELENAVELKRWMLKELLDEGELTEIYEGGW